MKYASLMVWIFALAFLLPAEQALGQVAFVPNEGQWPGDFAYKADLRGGALFFEKTGFTVLLREPAAASESGAHNHPHSDRQVSYRMEFSGKPHPSPQFSANAEQAFYHNYFLGKDKSRWRGGVPVYGLLEQREVYPGIDFRYHSHEGHLKYDILLSPRAGPSSINMTYSGLQKLEIANGRLILHTGIGTVEEYIPEAYQLIDGKKQVVDAQYVLKGNTVGFKVGNYRKDLPLVIDPVLEFSTFTGSTANNWGYTATYDEEGDFYGGGIALGSGYPTTLGVVQNSFNGGKADVAISKFSSSGNQLLFSTYLGGSEVEVPHSMVVDQQGNLIVLGSTGSPDFPTTANAFQENFSPGNLVNGFPWQYDLGSNVYLLKIRNDGKSLLASTLIGGNINDGVNTAIFNNYGDNARGEVINLPNNNIALAISVRSTDLPLNPVNLTLSDSTQNAMVAVFTPNLQSMVWGNYFGGNGDETGYGVRTDSTYLYLSGATTSTDLPAGPNAVQRINAGKIDGYLAKFDLAQGSLEACTYLGTSEDDQAFMVEVDRTGAIYTYGQSEGSMPVSPGVYHNSPSNQFVQKYNSALDQLIWSTQVGSSQGKNDLVPTAFMVDYCLNIYLSGWNGGSNRINTGGTQRGNTQDLPVTSDAFQNTTDGSDFYFMILKHNATSLLFASYFGGTSEEHVDGGTSRFSPSGTIYQAACAACYVGDFPTTPGAYSPSKPNSLCNLGAIKIDFEQIVQSVPEIDFTHDIDTVCNELHVTFANNSIKANKYYWDFGNGSTSTQEEPSTIYSTFGTYTITLVAIDSICGIRDTASITLEHTGGFKPTAIFSSEYSGCDHNLEAVFTNASPGNNTYYWDFGDGTTAAVDDPVHSFPSEGSYQVMMVATDILCQTSDTAYETLTFKDTVPDPQVQVWHPQCNHGVLEVQTLNHRDRFLYHWDYEGQSADGVDSRLAFNEAGTHLVYLTITDTLCSAVYEYDFKVIIEEINRDTYIPNAFSPNADGVNDEFIITGDKCGKTDLLRIFNRWGEVVFETTRPYEVFWDGTYHGKDVPQAVYLYFLHTPNGVKRGHLTLFR